MCVSSLNELYVSIMETTNESNETRTRRAHNPKRTPAPINGDAITVRTMRTMLITGIK
jgi:hypothetical protein